MIMRKWFSRGYWSYLLTGCKGWTNFWCRVRCHPEGVVWVNAGGLEPNMHCRTCDEDLG